MKIQKTFRPLYLVRLLSVFVCGLLVTSSVFALPSNVSSIKLCDSVNAFCSLDTSESVNLVIGGLSYLSALDSKTEQHMPKVNFACDGIVNKIAGDAEWSAFLTELRHGNVGSLIKVSHSARGWSGDDCRLGEVSSSVAAWLFATALFGFVGLSNRRRV